MLTLVELEEQVWFDTFKPVPNVLDPNASFHDDETGFGYMFETYGAEVEFVKSQDPDTIWTYGQGDDGGLYIWSGWHLVNRLGYFVTTVPVGEDIIYQITIAEGDEEDEDNEDEDE